MQQAISRFFAETRGLTTVEYAIAGAVISVAVLGAFLALGGSIGGTINIVDSALVG